MTSEIRSSCKGKTSSNIAIACMPFDSPEAVMCSILYLIVIIIACRLKKWGIVRFNGETLFSDGIWLGIELTEPCGKNDGAVQRTRYFRCPAMCGVFVRPMNCSSSEESMSRPNTPEIKRRLSSRAGMSGGLVKTPTRVVPRRGHDQGHGHGQSTPQSTGRGMLAHTGEARRGQRRDEPEPGPDPEHFRPRSYYQDFDSNPISKYTTSNSDGASTHMPHSYIMGSPSGERREQLLLRMTDAVSCAVPLLLECFVFVWHMPICVVN